MKYSRIFNSAFFIVIVIALVFLASSCNTTTKYDNTEFPEEFGILLEAYEALESEHLSQDTLDPTILTRGAIIGMLGTLDDPYAAFMEPELFKQANERLQSYFEGIGAEVTIKDGRITVISPIAGTPAERAGIQPGDVIISVNGEPTMGMSLFEAVSKIRGPKGTPVELEILHIDAGDPELITIIRDVINILTVTSTAISDDIWHIEVSSFSSRSNNELEDIIDSAQKSKISGVIIDVRNNPGGLVSSVVEITSQFLNDGLVLYDIDGRGKRTDWKVNGGGRAVDMPVVVIINGFSASASEVFAGAMRDHGRATLIGTTTFGKGSVNTHQILSDGSGLQFTKSRWYTPGGALIEGKGIEPDIFISPSDSDDADVQLNRAIKELESQIAGQE